jgi:hypothetical protein
MIGKAFDLAGLFDAPVLDKSFRAFQRKQEAGDGHNPAKCERAASVLNMDKAIRDPNGRRLLDVNNKLACVHDRAALPKSIRVKLRLSTLQRAEQFLVPLTVVAR